MCRFWGCLAFAMPAGVLGSTPYCFPVPLGFCVGFFWGMVVVATASSLQHPAANLWRGSRGAGRRKVSARCPRLGPRRRCPRLIVSLLSPFLRQLKSRVAIHGPYGFVQLSVSSCQALSPSPPPFSKTKPLTNPPLNPLLPHSQRGAPLTGDAGGGGGETAPHAAFVGHWQPPGPRPPRFLTALIR